MFLTVVITYFCEIGELLFEFEEMGLYGKKYIL